MSSTRLHLAAPVFAVALVVSSCSAPPEQAAPPSSAAPAQSAPPQAAPPTAAPPAAGAPAASEPQSESSDPSRNDVAKPPAISDDDLPPLPVTPFPAARPMEVVRAVFTFAARHPEVLSKVPCFCGCEHMGHRQNDDCFVKSRDARGVPTAWEEHGLG